MFVWLSYSIIFRGFHSSRQKEKNVKNFRQSKLLFTRRRTNRLAIKKFIINEDKSKTPQLFSSQKKSRRRRRRRRSRHYHHQNH